MRIGLSFFKYLIIFIGFSLCVANQAYAQNKPEKLTVILDWFPNPDHAPLFVAQQQGFFRDEGLDVRLVGPANPADPPKLVAAGKADIAITYQPQLLLAVQQGLPLVRIGTLVNQPLGCLLTQGNIKTLRDLRGKTIGYSTAGVDSAMLNAMLHSVGLSSQDVKLINVNYDLTQGLMAHRVDAVTGVQRNFELIQLELARFPVQAFYPEQHGVPPYDEFIFVANRAMLNKNGEVKLAKFLRAVQKGEAYLQQNPVESWLIFARNHPELNNELNHRAWQATLPAFALYPARLDIKKYDHFMNFMVQQKLLKEKLPIEKYAVEINL